MSDNKPASVFNPAVKRIFNEMQNKQAEVFVRGIVTGQAVLTPEGEEELDKMRLRVQDKVERKIGSQAEYLIDKMFELAEGVYVVDKQSKDELRYYRLPPNREAIQYLLDRVMGKPVQRSENKDTKVNANIVQLDAIIRNLAIAAPAPADATPDNTIIVEDYGHTEPVEQGSGGTAV